MEKNDDVLMDCPTRIQIFGSDEGHQLHVYGPGVVSVKAEHADHPYMKAHGAKRFDPKAEAIKAAEAAKEAKRQADIAAAKSELADAEKSGNADAIQKAQKKLDGLTK